MFHEFLYNWKIEITKCSKYLHYYNLLRLHVLLFYYHYFYSNNLISFLLRLHLYKIIILLNKHFNFTFFKNIFYLKQGIKRKFQIWDKKKIGNNSQFKKLH